MTAEQNKSRVINIALWITQALLALTLVWSGYMKLLNASALPYPWVKENPNLALTTGVADLLGGIGIILPAALRIKPRLTIYAAYGIIILMTSAIIFHISRGEANVIGFNILVGVLAAFVARGR